MLKQRSRGIIKSQKPANSWLWYFYSVAIFLLKKSYLNLPTEVLWNTSKKINYIYDASGTKLRKIVTNGTTTDYAGGFQYKDNSLQFFPTAEGYVNVTNGNAFNYVYNYTDHLDSWIKNLIKFLWNDPSVTSSSFKLPKRKEWFFKNTRRKQSPFHVTLFHEIGHSFADQTFNNKILQEPWVIADSSNQLPKDLSKSEIYASTIENFLRSEQNLPLRTHYSPGISESKLIEKSQKGAGIIPEIWIPSKNATKYLNEILKNKK